MENLLDILNPDKIYKIESYIKVNVGAVEVHRATDDPNDVVYMASIVINGEQMVGLLEVKSLEEAFKQLEQWHDKMNKKSNLIVPGDGSNIVGWPKK